MSAPLASEAVISECGTYRYELRRWWGGGVVASPLVVVMLNPSTADASVDDPTIRRVKSFAYAGGYPGIVVLNLFALRSPDPDALQCTREPIGPENDRYLRAALQQSVEHGASALAAWGAHSGGNRIRTIDRARAVMSLVPGVRWVCLGTTKASAPRHPLYVKGTQAFVPFELAPSAKEPSRG